MTGREVVPRFSIGEPLHEPADGGIIRHREIGVEGIHQGFPGGDAARATRVGKNFDIEPESTFDHGDGIINTRHMGIIESPERRLRFR